MESQNTEWKESWHDDYLDTINGMANVAGGTLTIGKNDKGVIIGIRNAKKLMEQIPNKVFSRMNFHPDVRTEITEDGKEYVVITIKRQKDPVFNGDTLSIRSGSTTRRLTGKQLTEFLIRRTGFSWTDIDAKNAKISDLLPEAIDLFVKKGTESKRMSSAAIGSDTESLLRRYDLINDDGITRAAAILFSENPQRVSYAAVTKIGAFSEAGILLRDDKFDGPVIMHPDLVMKALLDKYVQGTYDTVGLQRILKYPYPEKGLREAVMNATVHRDYSSVMHTTIRVYPDRVEIFNPGSLPEGWTAEELSTKHESRPANPLIASVFYDMGYVEKWASGIPMIRSECEAMGIPEPEFKADMDGIRITFRRAPEKDATQKNISHAEDLKDSEKKVYRIICEGVATTAKEISSASGVPLGSVMRATKSLIEKGLIARMGSKMDGKWVPK